MPSSHELRSRHRIASLLPQSYREYRLKKALVEDMKGEKKRRDALITLAQHYEWEVGYLDEVWWSRISQPNMHTWSERDEPLHLQELEVSKNDPDPKALACYGMLSAASGRMHLRFVSGRPRLLLLGWPARSGPGHRLSVSGRGHLEDSLACIRVKEMHLLVLDM